MHAFNIALRYVRQLNPDSLQGRALLAALTQDALDSLRSALTPGPARQWADRFGGALFLFWVIGLLAAAVTFAGIRMSADPGFTGAGRVGFWIGAVLVLTFVPSVLLQWLVHRPLMALDALTPLSASQDLCEQALRHVRASAAASDYRDQVVAQRELVKLDLTALAKLAQPDYEAQRLALLKALALRGDAACRELHKIDSPGPA